MVVTRAVVLITRIVLTAPLSRSGNGLVVSVQVAPVGRPELQERETLSGMLPVGVTVAVYTAGTPAGTVAVGGDTLMLKSFTVTLPKFAEIVEPGTPTEALFPRTTGVVEGIVFAVGVKTTLAVAVAPALRAPMKHCTVPLLALPQLPALTVADVNEAPEVGRLSVKVMAFAASPVLVIVYSKVTWFPTPTVAGVTVGVDNTRLNSGPNLLRKASVGPFKAN